MGVLNLINENMALGSRVVMNRTEPGHLKLAGQDDPLAPAEEASFADLVRKGFEGTNKAQTESSDMFVKMITEPDSVEVHDVTVAMAKANMSLQITKSVVDGAVKAYKDIINMR